MAGPLLPSCSVMEWTSKLRRLDWRAVWRSVWDSPPRLLALVLALVYAAALFFGFSWSRCFFTACPNVAKLAVYQPGGAPVLLDRNGETFADLAPAERAIVPLSSLPSLVPQAFLAVEDQRFYEHGGVDWKRVGGAVLANLRAGGFAQGFSTISMQLARNVFPERIPGEEQTTRRKLLEIRVAQEIEGRYSKEEILELYLNNIYFGNRARGDRGGVPPVLRPFRQGPDARAGGGPRRPPQGAQPLRSPPASGRGAHPAQPGPDADAGPGAHPRISGREGATGAARARRGAAAGADRGRARPLVRRAGAARARGAVRPQPLHPAAADRDHARLLRPAGRRGGAAAAAQAGRVRRPGSFPGPPLLAGRRGRRRRPRLSPGGGGDARRPRRRRARLGGRTRLLAVAVRPRRAGAPPARQRLQAVRLRGGPGGRLRAQPAAPRRAAQGEAARRPGLAAEELLRPLRGGDVDARRPGALAERPHGAAGGRGRARGGRPGGAPRGDLRADGAGPRDRPGDDRRLAAGADRGLHRLREPGAGGRAAADPAGGGREGEGDLALPADAAAPSSIPAWPS